MFDVRPGDGFGVFAVVGDDDGDGGIISPDAVDQILELIVPQEGLCSYGNEGTDVVLWRGGRSKTVLPLTFDPMYGLCHCVFTSIGSSVVQFGCNTVTDLNTEQSLMPLSVKLH